MNNQKPTIIDLYAGAGGLSLGAARADFHLALAVELDKHAMAAHKLNFPHSKHLSADILNLRAESLMREAGLGKGELSGLIGGPPCQGFSSIGRKKADDPRNDLFVKFFELVKGCEPKFFVAENVLGILDDQFDDVRSAAFSCIHDGYVLLEPIKLKASDFGVATTRERVFFIGYRKGLPIDLSAKDFAASKVNVPITVADALRGLPARINSNWLTVEQSWRKIKPQPDSVFWKHASDEIPECVGNPEAIRRYKEENLASGCFGTRHSPKVLKRYTKLKQGEKDLVSRAVRLKLDGLCPTLRAGTGSDKGSYQAVRPIHPTAPRVITPREAARLQGFPDWFQFAPTKWHSFRQIGNSVSPILAEVIFRIIKCHLIPHS